MLSGLQRWMGLKMHISGYDINCQYRIHFAERMKWMEAATAGFKSIVNRVFPWTMAAVGKFHLPAHILSCRFKFSFNWLPGSAMTDGEATERIWAQLNAIGKSTREMTPGHRHDAINDHHSDMNTRRVHGIGARVRLCRLSIFTDYCTAKATAKKHDDAEHYLKKAEKELAKVEKDLPPATRASWEAEEAQWLKDVVDIKKHKNLKNPYEPDKEKGARLRCISWRGYRLTNLLALTQKQALETLLDRNGPSATVEPGLVGAISEGIRLDDAKYVA